MGRTIDEVIAELPKASRERIDTRYHELRVEVLKIRQPSVSKIERQADMYLSTLRNYVEAIGGELELVVHLPSRPALHLHNLGDILPERKSNPPNRSARATKRAMARV